MKKVALLLPAYNEEKNIEIVIKEGKKFLKGCLIVVIDDGSKDKTFERAKKLKVIVLRHEKNKGKAEAIKTGMKFVLENFKRINYFLVADTDRQYSLKDGKKLLEKLFEGKNLVTGYRNFRKIPFRHRLGNLVWRKVFNLLFSTNLKDVGCGYFAFDKKLAKKLVKSLKGGYILESSLFITALKNKFKIEQVPVNVVYRKKRRIAKGIRIVFGVLIHIVREGIRSKKLF